MSDNKEIAVSVRNIHKDFVLPQSKNTSLKQSFVNIVRRKNKVVQKVLDGVSFDVYKGDFFGIVGRNGSGKSTLLKMLAGVYVPTAGDIQVNGGLTPFIELGVGFNPELSGRDNVYLNGSLLGYDRKQMDTMYDEIVEFAELGPFMDQKLKNYSSGMQVRLAFSIAIKAKNEILIFDEVLAVGDEAFQRKCLDVFEKYKAEGQTVILVTHDMDTVREFCTRAVLISDSKLLLEGSPQKIASEYSRLNQIAIDKESGKQYADEVQKTSIITRLTVDSDKRAVSLPVNTRVKLDISWAKELDGSIVMVDLFKNSGEHVTGFKSKKDNHRISDNKASVEITMKLAPGRYHFVISLRNKDDEDIEVAVNESEFILTNIDEGLTWSGIAPIDHKWL